MKKWVQSARYASRGIVLALREERNMRIHCIAAILAILLSFLLKFSLIEVSIISITCALVICTECVNSAVERILDMVKPRVALQLQSIKDLLAGSVLIASVSAIFVGIIMFAPKIASLLLSSLQTRVFF